ncbi:MAG: DUF4124 domain-containing protein [Gammaproteobacteria bacterium]|nr:DUF4124 domain-containing protein [Gammaproteobacteria bacterium]MCI0591745.1 DUF4124 domain-containing protein [Gammaproteobacteria bacterium]
MIERLMHYCLGALLFGVFSASYALYVWVDEDGVKHVSTVPRSCITPQKTVKLSCMPTTPSQEATLQREAERARRAAKAEYEGLLEEEERLKAERAAVLSRLKGEPISRNDLANAHEVADALFAIEAELDEFYDVKERESRREARAIAMGKVDEALALAELRYKEQQREAEIQDIGSTLEGLQRYFRGFR